MGLRPLSSASPMRDIAETIAYRAGIYRPARNAYDRLFRPDRSEARRRFLDFFRQFIPRGALVFDIGANQGWYTNSFLELGARVVAVEPIPEFAEGIARRHGSRVAVETVALGESEGRTDLRVGRLHVHSSLAPRWIEIVKEAGGERWGEAAISVDVTTLDQLIARHGIPHFTKIDVEGYEPEVLAGLSQALPNLSFEAQSRAPALASECIERLAELGQYEFNLSPGVELRLALDSWVSGKRIGEELERLDGWDVGAADVYARQRLE
jgi:FkbM family methyltransferase